jgi:hypothetical protein
MMYSKFFSAASLGMTLFLNMSNASAVEYIGQYCWSLTQTQDEEGSTNEGPFLLKLGVTHMGDSYYTAQGSTSSPFGTLYIWWRYSRWK